MSSWKTNKCSFTCSFSSVFAACFFPSSQVSRSVRSTRVSAALPSSLRPPQGRQYFIISSSGTHFWRWLRICVEFTNHQLQYGQNGITSNRRHTTNSGPIRHQLLSYIIHRTKLPNTSKPQIFQLPTYQTTINSFKYSALQLNNNKVQLQQFNVLNNNKVQFQAIFKWTSNKHFNSIKPTPQKKQKPQITNVSTHNCIRLDSSVLHQMWWACLHVDMVELG